MKKLTTIFIVLLVFISVSLADSFTDAIQDLARYTACIGQYSATQAGGGRYDDPQDYYTPQMIASRLAQESGNQTMTATFYGICFNYAKFGYEYLNRYEQYYNRQGMYENQFYLAGTHSDSNQIILSYPTTKGNHNMVQNGVYVKEIDYQPVRTHKHVNSTKRATHHAWLWIQRADGKWFWIDPTWTDNLGYVVYGYVSSNGEEIQCRPDKRYCINYPSYLNNLPLPPSMGSKLEPSATATSNNPEETVKNMHTDWLTEAVDKTMRKTFIDVDYSHMINEWIVLMLSADVPFSALSDQKVDLNKIGFSLEMPMLLDSIAGFVGLEYLHNLEDENNIHAGLFEFDFTRRLFSNLAWFIGGGVGLRFDFAGENWAQEEWKTGYLALKANTGFLINISHLFTKVDISYNNVTGFSAGVGIGIGLEAY